MNYNQYKKKLSSFNNQLKQYENKIKQIAKNDYYEYFISHFLIWFKKDEYASIFKSKIEKKKESKIKIFFNSIKSAIYFISSILIDLLFITIYLFIHTKNNFKKKFPIIYIFDRHKETFTDEKIKNYHHVYKYNFHTTFTRILNFKIENIFYYQSFNYLDLFITIKDTFKIYLLFKKIQFSINDKYKFITSDINYNLYNIYTKLFYLKLLDNFVKKNNITHIYSNWIASSNFSKIISYISYKNSIKYTNILSKNISKNNPGHEFKLKKILMPNLFFVNSFHNKKNLISQGIKKKYIYTYFQKECLIYSTKHENYNEFIFIVALNRNNKENKFIIKLCELILKKLDKNKVQFFFKYHPQNRFDKNINEKINIIGKNISNMDFKKILKKFKKIKKPKFLLTIYTTLAFKILNAGFFPLLINKKDPTSYINYEFNKSFGINILKKTNFFLEFKNLIKKRKNFFNSNKPYLMGSNLISSTFFNKYISEKIK
jgi:hypothetical protein